ncbi:MAG: toxic anion resistance protein [Clostridium sp.]|nr:toxic anion resistance protein [Clostridium sp.]
MSFDLELPDVEEVKEKVAEELSVSEERQMTVDETAKQKVEEIMGTDITVFEDRKNLTTAFEEFGADVMRKTESKNSILSKRMGELSRAGSETGEVAKGLQELAEQMRSLDPSLVDFDQKGLFGKISNPVKRYFDKYKTADSQIAEIVKSLENGKKMLKNDNVTLEIEQSDMRGLTKDLNEKIAMGNALDQYLTNAIENKKAEGGDEEKVRFVEEEVLFPLRQRIMDFQQMQVVSQQGCVAMDVIRRNNNELIRAVERAETVTVSSLRTAVTVAGALYNQRIVLEKVNLLNESTNRMIASTAEMLKTQGVEIQKQSSEAMISTETLRKSFEDTLQAMEDISNYKLEALPRIRKTIDEFKELADVGEKKLQQMEEAGAFLPSGQQQAIEDKKA